MSCRSSHDDKQWPRHELILHPDWTVEVPHDLEAERIAAALGGGLFCLELVDRLGDKLRRHAQLNARRWVPVVREPVKPTRAWPPIHDLRESRLGSLAWTVEDCLIEAADLKAIADALRELNDQWRPPYRPSTLVVEPDGIDQLWDLSIHPDTVVRIARELQVTVPLPVSTYRGIVHREIDLDWLRDTIDGRRDDAAVIDWAVWTFGLPDGDDPTWLWRWLELGLETDDIDLLCRVGYSPEQVMELAEARSWSVARCADMLLAWADCECLLRPGHWALLTRFGVDERYRPRRSELVGLILASRDLPDPPASEELAVMLAIAGTVPAVETALASGLRTAHEVAEQLLEFAVDPHELSRGSQETGGSRCP